jgi:transposase-like protein
MGKPSFSDEFKLDAVAQITERGFPVAEVSQRLGILIVSGLLLRSMSCFHTGGHWADSRREVSSIICEITTPWRHYRPAQSGGSIR